MRGTTAMKLRRKHLSDTRAFGMLYSMYSLDSWYWESTSEFGLMNSCLFDLLTHCVVFPRCVFAPSLVLTRISYSIFIHFLVPVVGRKVAFSAIGVFGSQLGEFQVHLTLCFSSC